MFTLPEEFSAATKSHFEAQLAMINALTSKAMESIEKIVDLNMNVVRASLEESTSAARQLMTAKDAQEFAAMTTAQAQPTAEKALAYSRHLKNIASSTQSDFTKTAEAQITETSRKMMALVEEVTKNAPAGSEQVVAMMKSALGNANAGYEQLSKTTRQAVEALEGNLNNAMTQMSALAEQATSRSKK